MSKYKHLMYCHSSRGVACSLTHRRAFASSSSSSSSSSSAAASRDHTIRMVRAHDPAGYVPGQLLPSTEMKETYYAVRSFWIETGLRFQTTAQVPPHSTPEVHLQWWTESVENLYHKDNPKLPEQDHPTLSLLHDLIQKHDLSKDYFDQILQGRRTDLEIKQYATLGDLVHHAQASCGSLARLVLESGGMKDDMDAHEAARLVGICHGLTNALRLSVPVVSTTGRLIVPQDLCVKYNVKSPRYLLSALGQGDEVCRRAFHSAIRDIADEARLHLQQARDLRPTILEYNPKAISVLIPGVASEVFLNRLEAKAFDLTDKNLRNVGLMEQYLCIGKMIAAYYQKTY